MLGGREARRLGCLPLTFIIPCSTYLHATHRQIFCGSKYSRKALFIALSFYHYS